MVKPKRKLIKIMFKEFYTYDNLRENHWKTWNNCTHIFREWPVKSIN